MSVPSSIQFSFDDTVDINDVGSIPYISSHGTSILLPWRIGDKNLDSRAAEWLSTRENNIHEPGLLSWLNLISCLDGKPHKFLDIGSLYGYIGIMYCLMRPDACVRFLEVNPLPFHFLQNLITYNPSLNLSAFNSFVGTSTSPSSLSTISGFNCVPYHNFDFLLQTFKYYFKRVIGKHISTYPPFSCYTHTQSFADLCNFFTHRSINILKVDAEGTQYGFLLESLDLLANRDTIILMETDIIEKFSAIQNANSEVINRFCKAGYYVYWGNHRRVNSTFARITPNMHHEININGLAVMIPKKYTSILPD